MTKRKVLFVIGGVMAVAGLLILAPFGDISMGIQIWEALFSMIAMLASLTSFVFGSRARPDEEFNIQQLTYPPKTGPDAVKVLEWKSITSPR